MENHFLGFNNGHRESLVDDDYNFEGGQKYKSETWIKCDIIIDAKKINLDYGKLEDLQSDGQNA